MIRGSFSFSASVISTFLGIEGNRTLVPGRIIAVESYKGSVPTFTWMSESGHIFCYLPPHAFCSGFKVTDLVDFNCPSDDIDVHVLNISGPGWGKVKDEVVNWKRYLLTCDWLNGNYLAHLVVGFGGELTWLRNSKFQVGGDSFSAPEWKKSREDWKIV